MSYLILLLTSCSLLASAYAITVPARIQSMLNITEDTDPEAFLHSLGRLEKLYLSMSIVPLVLIPLLAFSDFARGVLYASFLALLSLSGIIFRKLYVKWKRAIILESTLEIIIYCDILRTGVVAFAG